MIAELSRYTDDLPDLIRWRVGRPSAYGQVAAFGPLADIVKAEAGVLDSDDPDVAIAKIEVVLARVVDDPDERAFLKAHLSALLVGSKGLGDLSLDEAFAAWARFLESLAAQNMTVLVLEDLHDALDPFLGFVERLLERDRNVPMLIIAAARPELLERYPGWGIGKGSVLVRLPPLSHDDTTHLVRSLLGSQPLPAASREAVVRRAAGNPLYAEEFIRMMRERVDGNGSVIEIEGSPGHGTVSLPTSIHALLASRLDALPADLRATVQDASVVGSIVWAGAVADVSGRPPAQVVAAARRAGRTPVRPQGPYELGRGPGRVRLPPRAGPGGGLRPDPPSGACAQTRRRRLLDRSNDDTGCRRPRRTSRLPLRGGMGSRGRGRRRRCGGVGPRPRRWTISWRRGRTPRNWMPIGRTRLFERALSLMPADHPQRPVALRGAGVAAQAIGNFDAAEADLLEAVATFERAEDPASAADARVLLARALFERGDVDSVLPLLREALDDLEGLPRGPAFAHAATRVAGHLWVMGDHEGCIRWADRALELAESLDLAAQHVLALQYRGASRSKLGDPGGLEDLREALRIGKDRGLGEETAVAYNNYAYELWFHRGAWASLDAWEEMLAFCEDRGLATSAAWARSGLLEPAFDVGAWDRVLSVAATVRAWDADHGGQTQPGAVAITFQGWVALRRGDGVGAASASADALARATDLGTSEYRAPALVLAAEVASAAGDHLGAIGHLDDFLEVTAPQPVYRIIALPMVVRLLAAAGASDRALELVRDQHERLADSERLALSLLTAKAEVAEIARETQLALERYEEAVRRWDRYGFPVETARCGVGAGRCAISLGRPQEARAMVRRCPQHLRSAGRTTLARGGRPSDPRASHPTSRDDAVEESLRLLTFGWVKIASGRPTLQDRSLAQEAHLIGDIASEPHLVGRDHHRHAPGRKFTDRRRAPRPPARGRARS